MIAKASGVVGSGNKAAAEGIHLCERANHSGVAEIVGIFTSRKAGAGGGLDGDNAIVGLAAQLFTHEGSDKSAEV